MSRIHSICVLTAIAVIPVTGVAQQQVHPVPEVYGIFSKNDQSGAPEADLIVSGEFARVMFELMVAEAVDDTCGEGLIKRDGNGLQCYQDTDGATQCSFGYDFVRQMLTPGPLVC